MADTKSDSAGPLGRFIRAFYEARRTASLTDDLDSLRQFIATDVCWKEPDIGTHMGNLRGRDAVLDMIHRALATTGGTFDLTVTSTVETNSHVAASIAWSADKGGRRIDGQELAVYQVRDGFIVSAWFYPENIADDRDFWDDAALAPS